MILLRVQSKNLLRSFPVIQEQASKTYRKEAVAENKMLTPVQGTLVQQ